MKKDWQYKRLEDVCNINYGTRVVQKKDQGSKYYVYGGGGKTFMVDNYNREDCFIVSRFAMSPKCTRYVKGKFFLNDSGLSVSTKIDVLSQSFVDKVLLANNDVIYSYGKGMAQKNLDMSSFRNMLIPIPPLVEQERIVSELDLLSGIIDKQKAQLKELDNLAQSIFYDMFGDPVENEKGWDVKKLEDIAYIGLGFTHTPQYVKDGIAFLSVKDISSGKIVWDNIKYVSEEEYMSAPKGAKPNKGDILFCRVGTMGKPVIIDTDIPFCTFVSLGYLHIKDHNISNIYVKYWMQSFSFDMQVKANVKGVAIKNLNTGWLKKFKILIPSYHWQEIFAEKIDHIEKQKEAITRSIAETQQLFDSRMAYWFD